MVQRLRAYRGTHHGCETARGLHLVHIPRSNCRGSSPCQVHLRGNHVSQEKARRPGSTRKPVASRPQGCKGQAGEEGCGGDLLRPGEGSQATARRLRGQGRTLDAGAGRQEWLGPLTLEREADGNRPGGTSACVVSAAIPLARFTLG